MITHWQNILKGKRMSKRNITFIIMIITLLTLPLSACGKNNISTDNSQKLQSESGQEYDDSRDTQMIPAGESQTNGELQTTGESQKTGEKKNVQENASDVQDNNSELPPVSIVPESTAAASSDAADKNTSGTDSTGSGNDKTENRRTDPIELPFVPAY
jgi:hypothetical protein